VAEILALSGPDDTVTLMLQAHSRPGHRGGLSRLHETTDPAIIVAKLAELRADFPPSGPYYLTHNDLNIIAQDDKITAALDWEMAGYYCTRGGPSVDYQDLGRQLFNPMWALPVFAPGENVT